MKRRVAVIETAPPASTHASSVPPGCRMSRPPRCARQTASCPPCTDNGALMRQHVIDEFAQRKRREHQKRRARAITAPAPPNARLSGAGSLLPCCARCCKPRAVERVQRRMMAGIVPAIHSYALPPLPTRLWGAGRVADAPNPRIKGQGVKGAVLVGDFRLSHPEALPAPRADATGREWRAVARMPYNSIIRSLKERSKVAHL
jgi:hypothetical protein